MSPVDVGEAITRAHHEEWARAVATLTRDFGDLDVAEEAAAEAFATAAERWPADGVPPSPGGWLTTTARRKALDRIRRENKRDDGEVAGLLALMLLIEARRTARVSVNGELVTLGEQDRGAWDAALVAEGHRLVRERLATGQAPGRYQVQAAINAVHTSARDVRDTDWSQVVALYDQLFRLDPSPIVALNRAVAIAELHGPDVALGIVDRLQDELAGYHAYFAARADILRRLGRSEEARAAYDRAIALAGNTAETAYLTRRRDQLR